MSHHALTRDAAVGCHRRSGGKHDDEGEAHEEKPERELGRHRWLARPEPDPQPREDRCEHDHKERLGNLEPRRRKLESEQVEVGVAIREERE